MVRAAVILLLMLASPVAAQTTDPLPSVDSEAPVQLEPGAAPGLPEGIAAETKADPASPLPVETDITALVLKAHPVVQAVMGLLAASILAVMTVFLFKVIEFKLAFHRLARSSREFAQTKGLALAGSDICPLVLAARAARDEVAGLPTPLTAELRLSARDRLELSLERIDAGMVQQMRSGTGLLASIGAVAPFVGLFGTVFGIMNSFLAIAATKTTNLSVVAPGIAEALLATGIGLAAAIPAVLLYNRCMRRIAAFRHRLADGTAELRRRFSHELDGRMAAGG